MTGKLIWLSMLVILSLLSIAPMEELNCQLVCVFGNDGERIGLYNRIKDIGEVQ